MTERKHILLINPPLMLEQRYGKDMQRFGAVAEPLGLAYVAAGLEAAGNPVAILDAPALGMNLTQVVEHTAEVGPDIVGLTLLTPMFGITQALCRALKVRMPEIHILLGGPHISALPERTLEEIPEADVCCIGEGDRTVPQLVDVWRDGGDLSQVNGICYRDNGIARRTPPREFVKDLDSIPPPARHLLPMEAYQLTASRARKSSFCPTVIVARGCPFKCSFCSRPFGRTLRTHGTDRIISEIRTLVDTYGAEQINIEADTLTANRKFLSALCRGLVDSGLSERISWTCESRVNTVTQELLELMRKAGCWQISYGVESGVQRILDKLDKTIKLEQVEKAFAMTKEVGIGIRGFFMLGVDTETRAESWQTIEFAKKLDPDWAQFTVTIPYPGTPMFDELEANGRIRSYNWDNYNTWNGWRGVEDVPFVPEGRSVEELTVLQKQAMRAFYLRPRVFLRALRDLRSPGDLAKYAAGFFVLVKTFFQARRPTGQGVSPEA